MKSFDTLILEGGSLRCSFTAGVLDALLLLGPLEFKRAIGVSAGAMVMASHFAGQYKHFYRIAKELVDDGSFIRFSSVWSEEGIMNLAHLQAHVKKHAPLDLERLTKAQALTEMLVVTTSLESGIPIYTEPTKSSWLRALVASSTLPLVTRGRAKMNGEWVFDGGYADPIPLNMALELGGNDILVIRTRPTGDHVSQSYLDSFASYWYRHNTDVAKLFETWHDRYNDVVDQLREGGDETGRTWEEISPPYPLKTDGWNVSASNVMSDYKLGVETALNWWAIRNGHLPRP